MAVVDWLEANIDSKIRHTGNGREVYMDCPYCGEIRHRFYVNLETLVCHCHNCGWSPTFLQLIQYVEGVSYSRASVILKDVRGNIALPENISRDMVGNMFMDDLRKDLQKRAIPLPDEYTLLNPCKTNIVTKRAVKYLNSRGITNKQIIDHQMGFCMSGEYKNRVIIPITENGELRFWVARAITKDAKLKEKSPSDEVYQISKSEVIFNIDRAAKKYHSVVISEGIFDALSWGDIGVSLLGKSLYQEQLNILLDYRELLTDGVYVALDWDAKEQATELAEKLIDFFKVKVINIPKVDDDPNNYLQRHGKQAMWKLIASAEEYSELSSVKRLLI